MTDPTSVNIMDPLNLARDRLDKANHGQIQFLEYLVQLRIGAYINADCQVVQTPFGPDCIRIPKYMAEQIITERLKTDGKETAQTAQTAQAPEAEIDVSFLETEGPDTG